MKAKDYEKAVTLYSKALELSPNGPNSHIFLVRSSVADAAGGGVLLLLLVVVVVFFGESYYC